MSSSPFREWSIKWELTRDRYLTVELSLLNVHIWDRLSVVSMCKVSRRVPLTIIMFIGTVRPDLIKLNWSLLILSTELTIALSFVTFSVYIEKKVFNCQVVEQKLLCQHFASLIGWKCVEKSFAITTTDFSFSFLQELLPIGTGTATLHPVCTFQKQQHEGIDTSNSDATVARFVCQIKITSLKSDCTRASNVQTKMCSCVHWQIGQTK